MAFSRLTAALQQTNGLITLPIKTGAPLSQFSTEISGLQRHKYGHLHGLTSFKNSFP